MRNLTIQRHKSFVGCLAKMKVYIEDPASGELVINEVPCRKLGDLKNGEQKTFSIGEQAARVFVIVDKLSRNYCNEYCRIPEGGEEIFLSGKNKYNPANGNAFRFDGNNNEEVLAHRKRGTKKGLVILILAALVGAVIGYVSSSRLFDDFSQTSKTFSADKIQITLTEAFEQMDGEDFIAVYDSSNAAVFVSKEDFSSAEGLEALSLKEYGDLLVQNIGESASELKTVDGLTYFTYSFENTEVKETYEYHCYLYKTDDAFWIVNFAIVEDEKENLPHIQEWAKSVVFSD